LRVRVPPTSAIPSPSESPVTSTFRFAKSASAGHGQERVPPALRYQLVLEVDDPSRVFRCFSGRLAIGGGDAALDRVGVVELEEGAGGGR
jgi:hypothetical protein